MIYPPSYDPEASDIVDNPEMRAQLIRASQGGDKLAFHVIYYGYYRRIWNCLYTLVGYELAEDLLQETFLLAWKSIKDVDCHSDFLPWVKTIAVNRAIDRLRRKKIISFHPLSVQDEDARTVDPEKVAIDKVCENQTLATLSEQERICIILADKWNYSHQEIAKFLGIKEKTVSGYISRGRQKFRDEYSRHADDGPRMKRRGDTAS